MLVAGAAAQVTPRRISPPPVTPPDARHLVWQYKFDPAPSQRRDWVRQGTGEWMELYPDGRSSRFAVIDKQTVLHGVKGVTVIDPGRLKAFIPDTGVIGPYAKVLYFIDLTGDTGEWQVLGIFTEQP
jgi:hypothetical protein